MFRITCASELSVHPLPTITPDNRKYIVEVSGHAFTAGTVQFRNLPGGTEGNHDKTS